MSIQRSFRLGVLLAVIGSTQPVSALDLLASYEAALAHDADYQAAQSAAEAGREWLPLARAQLLPAISFNASHFQNDLTAETRDILGRTATSRLEYPSKNYALTLRQPLYRPALLAGYDQAGARVEGVEAQFDKAGQDLAQRLVGAYLNVLLAEETQQQLETQRQAIEAQLAAARRAFAAGQGTRTDIDDAQAKLDLNHARLLAARQQIAQARHELEIMIGSPVVRLRRLGARVPAPDSLPLSRLEAWLSHAEAHNPELRDLRARIEVARHELARVEAGHKPTLDLVAQKSWSESDSVTSVNNRYVNQQLGLQLAVPLYAGGYVSAQQRQALAALSEAEQRYEAARRRLATQVRKEFQGVVEGMQRIAALETAERSAQQSLLANEKGFLAGTRSRVDILNAQEALASTRLELKRERLAYFLSRARLLALSGGLDRAAIADMNQWFVE